MNTDSSVILRTATLTLNGNKKPYRTPRLQSYGQMHTLTQGGGSLPDLDGQSGMAMPLNPM